MRSGAHESSRHRAPARYLDVSSVWLTDFSRSLLPTLIDASHSD